MRMMQVIYLVCWNRPYADFCLWNADFLPEHIRNCFGVHNRYRYDYKQIDKIVDRRNMIASQFGLGVHRGLKERLECKIT